MEEGRDMGGNALVIYPGLLCLLLLVLLVGLYLVEDDHRGGPWGA